MFPKGLFNNAVNANRCPFPLNINVFFVREMIELLMAKCELTETEVLEAEKNFMAANPSGVISKEEFVLSMKVTLDTSKLG